MKRFIWLIIVSLGIFYFVTLKSGIVWGDDWAMYVHHAKNICEGKPYAETGFIYNESNPTYSPQSYPPGFPLILVPFYAVSGLNLFGLKIPVIICLLLSFFILFLIYRKHLSPPLLFALILVIGINPYVHIFTNYILSDFPFLFSVLLSAWLIEKYYSSRVPSVFQSALIGCCIFYACCIRPPGALFIPALLIYDLIKNRTLTKGFFIVAITFGILFLFQSVIFQSPNGYINMMDHYDGMSFHEILLEIKHRFKFYRWAITDFWLVRHDASEWMKHGRVFTNIFLSLVAIGFVVRLFRKFSAVEFFVLFYFFTILIFPGFQGARYFIPLIPFFFFYVFSLFNLIKNTTARYSLISIFILPILLFYSSAYRKSDQEITEHNIQDVNAQRLFDFVKNNTQEESVFVLAKPRAFSLYTNRSATVYHHPENQITMKDFLFNNRIDYAVRMNNDLSYFNDLINQNPANFPLVYANEDYGVYQFIP